jgi:fatty acid desaturase
MRVVSSPLVLAVMGLLLPSAYVAMVATPSTQKVPAALAEQASTPRTISATALPLRIDGVWYDLQDYANRHKGGRWLLDYARGRDVTAIFHAIHMHGERTALATLSTLPTLDVDEIMASSTSMQGTHVVAVDDALERPLPTIDSPLRRDLQAMLQRKFPTLESMKATPEHWARTAVAAVLCANCWMGWYHGDALAVLLLPLAQWLLAAHTVHEATHGALSSDPRINYWAQFTAHPILFNVYVWIPQHILSHHQYTNDPQHDVDVHHFASARLAKEQGPYTELSENDDSNEGWTFVWKGCLTTLGTCILQPLRTLSEKPTPNFDVNITPVPAAVGKQKLLLSMLPSFFVLLYPIGAGLAGAMTPPEAAFAEIWPWVGMSIIWTAMTQTSHIQEDCQWDAGASDDCWTTQQIATALDYSVGNRVLTWATAGLNNQGLHHAMPTVSSAHFCDLYDEYEAICRKHGVQPRQTQDLGSACRECLDYVFRLNAPVAVPSLEE